jgi:hypothetical protein
MKHLKRIKLLLLAGMALTLLQACPPTDDRYGGGGGYYGGGRDVDCGGNHKLRVEDLDISPDPVSNGQRISRFHVRLRADGSGECQTRLSIRDRDQTVAQGTTYRLRPGINDINLVPSSSYRFEGGDRCFTVTADIQNTNRAIDAARNFCAKNIGRGTWTFK